MHTTKTVTNIDTIRAIDAVIETFLHTKQEKSADMSVHYQTLWADVTRLMHSGGKRLRPRLTVLAYQMFGGKDVDAILPAAAALELLHLGMLVHDDIIDRDYIRYGVDNIAGSYDKLYETLVTDTTDRLHYSHGAALLAGDLLLSEAYLLMAESHVEATTVLAIQRLLADSIFEVIGGELLDTESAFRGDGAVRAEMIALYKTASYTSVLPLLVGAKLAGVSETDQAHVRALGRSLGIAFQLRDDIIGVFGDETKTGKTAVGDIREGKHTYMVEQFYALATASQRELFDRHFGDQSISDNQVEILRALLRTTGALESTENAITGYEKQARSCLRQLTIDPTYFEQLNDLILVVTKRVK